MTKESLAQLVRPGAIVVVGDGAGTPSSVFRELSDAARGAGDISLWMGWTLGDVDGLDFAAFRTVRTFMGGYRLAAAMRSGLVEYVPCRVGAVPALLRHLRPSLLIATGYVDDQGLWCRTESSWVRAAVDAGAVVACVEPERRVSVERRPTPARAAVTVGTAPDPITTEPPHIDMTAAEIGQRVASLVTPGSTIQVAPGAIGDATLAALDVPVAIHTGIITDAVMELDRRGLLAGQPIAPYVVGSAELYEWTYAHPCTEAFDCTHSALRLQSHGGGRVSVNTALEIDTVGQVNVERVNGVAVAGVGGHPDFAAAACSANDGLSVIALPTQRRGRPTLVERLGVPTSTPRHDVDIVVTELGIADLRGRTDREREQLITALWHSS